MPDKSASAPLRKNSEVPQVGFSKLWGVIGLKIENNDTLCQHRSTCISALSSEDRQNSLFHMPDASKRHIA